MKDEDKTREQLINELTEIRRRIAELETLEAERKRAEEKLRQSEEQFRQFFDNEPNYCYMISPDGIVLDVNKAALKVLGYKKEQLVGETLQTIYAPESLPKMKQYFEKWKKTGTLKDEELTIVTKDGNRRVVLLNADRVTDMDGKLLHSVSVQQDITERKEAEQFIRTQAEVTKNMAEGVYIVGLHDFIIRWANPKFEEMFGYEPGEVIGKHASIVNAPTDLTPIERADEIMEVIHRTGKWHGEVNNIKKDGTLFWCYASVSVFTHTEYGEVLLAVHTDITEHKQVEEELQESEENFRNSLDNSPLGIRIIDIKAGGETIFANQAIRDIYGYSSIEEFKSIPAVERHTPKSYAERQERVRKREAGEPVPDRFEQSIIRKDGEVRHLKVFNREVLWDGEQQFQLIYLDITDRKQAEEALRESEKKYKSLINNVKLGVFRSTPEPAGKFLEVNPAMEEITGYRRKELLQMNVADLYVYPEQRGLVLEEVASGRGRTAKEVRFRRKDGTEIVVLDRKVAVRDDAGKVIYFDGIMEDITQRKRAEVALRKSEKQASAAIEAARALTFSYDIATGKIEWGGAIEEITGYTREEFTEVDIEGWVERIHPDDRDEVLSILQEAMGKDRAMAEYRFKTKKGYVTLASISLTEKQNGKPVRLVGVLQDITERKQAEEREKQLQRELSLASRLASIGQLAAGVAHEINNPLTGILVFSERLLRKSTDKKVSRDLKWIHNEALRAAKVVENLLTFARRREPKKEYSNINSVVRKALELRAYQLKTANIEVETGLAPGLPRVMADFHQVQEVFLNIILNAEQVMVEADHGGKFTIKTQQMKNCIRVSFADDGPGIPAEHLDRVFDPFFTTREEKGGTGLGLSVCHGIVAEHGGRIYAKSKPGKGATFVVELPLTTEE